MKNTLKFKKFRRKSLIMLASLSCIIPSLSSCDFNEGVNNVKDWFSDVGEKTVNFFNGNVVNWWNSVADGAVRVYDDVSKFVVNTSKTVSVSVCNCYETVKDGVVTFYNGIIDEVTIKEQSRATSDFEMYKGDTETLVYAIVSSELSKYYDVFPAYIYHPETNEVIDGLAYTDRSDVYKTSDGEGFYGAGFISLFNEIELDKSLINKGIEIYVPEEDSASRFVYSYTMNKFTSHFIANNKYVVFGVNNNNSLTFTESARDSYERDIKKYGALYDYDKSYWVYGEGNEYITTNGNILDPSCLNSLKAARNITDTDEGSASMTFSIDNIINCISNSIYAVKTKLMSMKETKILGANLNDILTSLGKVTASDVVKVNEDGFTFNKIPASFKIGPNVTLDSTTVAKTLAIIATVEAFVGFLGCSILEKFFPVFAIIKGAFAAKMGAYLDLVLQLFLEGKSIQEVNWLRLIIKGIAGGFSAYTPIVADAAIDAAAESTIAFITEGKSIIDTMEVFSYAFVTSLLIAGIIQGISKLGSAIAKGIKKLVVKYSQKGVMLAGKELAEASSEYAQEMAENTANKTTRFAADTVSDTMQSSSSKSIYNKKIIRQFLSDNNPNYVKVDKLGNEITKKSGAVKELIEAGEPIYIKPKSTCDPDLLDLLAKFGCGTNEAVAGYNGRFMVFSSKITAAYTDVGPDVIGKTLRSNTFDVADKALMKAWASNTDSIPDFIKEYFANRGINPATQLTTKIMKDMRKNLGLTWHEVTSQALQLVPTAIHKSISHSGGVAFVKAMIAINNAQALIGAIRGAA